MGAPNTGSVDVRCGPAFFQAKIRDDFYDMVKPVPFSFLSGDSRSQQPTLDGKLGDLFAILRYSHLHV